MQSVCLCECVKKVGTHDSKGNHVPRAAKNPAMAATPRTAAAVRSFPPRLGVASSSFLPLRALFANTMNDS